MTTRSGCAYKVEKKTATDSSKVSVRLFIHLGDGRQVKSYSRTEELLDSEVFKKWTLGVMSPHFTTDEDLDDVHSSSKACELYHGKLFDSSVGTYITAQPDSDEDWTDRDSNFLHAPGDGSKGWAMCIGKVIPPRRHKRKQVNKTLYQYFFGARSKASFRVPDWYGERGGTYGVETQPMCLAFIVIGNGRPLLLACENYQAGNFRIIGRGVNAMLRFADVDGEEPCTSAYYIFVSVPQGASAPETYNDTLRRLCSVTLDSREKAYIDRLLIERIIEPN